MVALMRALINSCNLAVIFDVNQIVTDNGIVTDTKISIIL